MSSKVGIGVITCNRPDFLTELLKTIPPIGEVVVVNDGAQFDSCINIPVNINLIQHKKNKGIANSKNDALQYLLLKNCKHIFLIEDDIALGSPEVLEKYIHASELSGIFHFNYAFHGPLNKTNEGNPNPRKIIKYSEDIGIAFYNNIVGALSYFRDEVIQKVGFMDPFYKNVLEHVEHTYRISLAGFHPPFRWFCDIEGSENMIKELDPCLAKSINSKNVIPIQFRAKIFNLYFMIQHGMRLSKIGDVPEKTLINYLSSRSNVNIL